MPITCDNCGRENEDEFKFCLGCGSKLSAPAPEPEPEPEPEKLNCPSCGTEVPAGFKFCGACGHSLADIQPPKRESTDTGKMNRRPGQSTSEKASVSTSPGKPASAGASTSKALGELTVIRPNGTEGARIELRAEGVTLGRDSSYDVLAEDAFLAKEHARIERRGDRFVLTNLDDVNGVFWRLRDDVELEDGDLLRVGQELLRFELFDELDPIDGRSGDGSARAHGSPNPGIWGRLALVAGPGLETRAFALSGKEATIGRELGSIIFADDGFVSGKHARIYREDGKVYFRDLGSSNGSYIQIKKERELSHNDLVLMGQQLLKVSL